MASWALWVLLVLPGEDLAPAQSGPLTQPTAKTLDRRVPNGRGDHRLPGGPASSGTRRALILCGLPGDQPHRAMYARSVQKLYVGLTDRCGFAPQHVWVHFGSKPRANDVSAICSARGLSTREAIEQDVEKLRRQAKPLDTLWVIVLGHAHFDGRHAFLNLPGPDFREDHFGQLFQGVQSRQQVFIITTPASGFFIKHLSAPGRIVISATEADQEVNETLFHVPLADVLSNPPEKDEYDRDRDGRITVLDLYLTVVRRVMEMYRSEENIPTEHAQLDDNGDGRCTEVQIDYLPPELDGRARPGTVPQIEPGRDGALAATIEIGGEPGLSLPFVLPSMIPIPWAGPLPVFVPLPFIGPVRTTN